MALRIQVYEWMGKEDYSVPSEFCETAVQMKLAIERVPCKCGDLDGFLILRRAVVETEDSKGNVRKMTPTEFEALAGRGSTKKWKESVKVGPDIPEFQGKAIGAYMRDQLGVDINRGVLQPHNPDKRTSETKSGGPKATASHQSKSAAPISTKPARMPPIKPQKDSSSRKRHSSGLSDVSFELSASPSPEPEIQQQQQQADKLSTKLPLIQRINDHSDKQFCCYEIPCEAGDAAGDSIPLGSNAGTASILMKSPGSGSQAAAQMVDVPIREGRPSSTKGILCLETVPLSSLIDLGFMSASKEADLSTILLSEVPSVPADRLSKIPLYESSGRKKLKIK